MKEKTHYEVRGKDIMDTHDFHIAWAETREEGLAIREAKRAEYNKRNQNIAICVLDPDPE